METWIATTEYALSAKWKVVDEGHNMHGVKCEDMSIVTYDDKEVVGSSEWMRADRAVFEHIVQIHNASLPNSVERKAVRIEA